MTSINQGSHFRGWSATDQKQLTELAVAGQSARSKYAQVPDVSTGGPSAPTADKLRATAFRAGRTETPPPAPKDTAAGGAQAPSEARADNRTAMDDATVRIRNMLRSGEDGQSEMIQNFEDLLKAEHDRFRFTKETIDIYEKTGEVWSVQPNGKFKVDDDTLKLIGGVDKYMQRMHEVAEGSEKFVIPEFTKTVQDMKTARLERLREYGLAPPALDTQV